MFVPPETTERPDLGFHPAVEGWFRDTFADASEAQARGWPHIRAGRDTLIAAPTGSGKTLAAFLCAIDRLIRQEHEGTLADGTHVVYVSPLKALSKDVECNLYGPLEGIQARKKWLAPTNVGSGITVGLRTGDTPASERQRMARRPPHILVTTPESLYILLTSDRGRAMLGTVSTVIVDEIHAIAHDKRGAHLALSLERLDALCERPPQRVGLSATQRPLELVGSLLAGSRPLPTLVDAGHLRTLDLAVEVPSSPLEAVMSNEVWDETYNRIADLVREHRTTLVFVNTRRMSERATMHLSRRLGDGAVTAHHGSLSKERRERAEARLKEGDVRALVATSSLELGIDVGSVDLVCQIGSTRSIARLLQRVGRSGHGLGRVPKGRLFPTSRDELVECAALAAAIRDGALDTLQVPRGAVDILAQQIAAEVSCRDWSEDELFDMARRAYPYRDLERDEFDEVMTMLADGFTTRRGRRAALVHRDRVNGRVRARRGTRLLAVTSGGAIPDTSDYDVVLDPSGTFLGTVNEDFAVESMPGDVFQLGHASWRIAKLERGTVRVHDAEGQPPSIPFWLGEAPGRTAELSEYVSLVRSNPDASWLTALGLTEAAAAQVVEYLTGARAALGAMPSHQTLVAERFFDETGSSQLVLHSPFGSRINRAWGLALRKRFCRQFNFELQAAATEDAILLSLGPTHSFATAEVFDFLKSSTVREVLVQALLDAPMFQSRWRWNATRSLALPRRRGGVRVAPQLVRMQAEDLIAVVFPDQLACLENIQGEREVPDHPLVRQTIDDCLHEAMDIDALEALLASIELGEVELVARDLVEPSPLALEIISARPYSFLDDAPLEERRTQAVQARRWLDPGTAGDLGALDAAAVHRVSQEAFPTALTSDEAHEALLIHGFVTVAEAAVSGWDALLAELSSDRRACVLSAAEPIWVAAETLHRFAHILPGARRAPSISPTDRPSESRHDDLVELIRGRLEALGPVTAQQLARPLGLATTEVTTALYALEAEGFVFRGRYTPGETDEEWCERRLLARIHRATLTRLRGEIQPVSGEAFMRFLVGWQHLHPSAHVNGPDGLAAVIGQLAAFEATGVSWEAELLPARVGGYTPSMLDDLTSSGRAVWGRMRSPSGETGRPPTRTTPIALADRPTWVSWRRVCGGPPPLGATGEVGGGEVRAVREALSSGGAVFFVELARNTRLLPSRLEAALGELVTFGVVSSDSYRGYRALTTPTAKRPRFARRARYGVPAGIEAAGRWFLLPDGEPADEPEERDRDVEAVALGLVRRYGVVFRALAAREAGLPPWRTLLWALRRLEARGELRGGRFVAPFGGEQYALPEAVSPLRAARTGGDGALVAVAAADPANLTGIMPGWARLAAFAGNRFVLSDGELVARRTTGEIVITPGVPERIGLEAEGLLRRGPAARVAVSATARGRPIGRFGGPTEAC